MSSAVLLPQINPVATVPAPARTTTGHAKRCKAIVQALRLQAIVFNAVSPDLKPQEISGLARAWCDLNEERRKLAMQPLPRPIDTTKIVKRGRSRSASPAPAEPVEPIPAPKAA